MDTHEGCPYISHPNSNESHSPTIFVTSGSVSAAAKIRPDAWCRYRAKESGDNFDIGRAGRPGAGIVFRGLGERRSEEVNPVGIQDHEQRMIGQRIWIGVGDSDGAVAGVAGMEQVRRHVDHYSGDKGCGGWAWCNRSALGVGVGVGTS